MRKTVFTLFFLILASCLLAQIQFGIESFADSTKYGWQDWRGRAAYREDLLNRQEMLQLYEMESSSIGAAILKSALVPGFGQITSKAGTKGTIFLGAELLSLGVSLYLYDRSNYYYNQYLTATQIDDIQQYYSLAQTPRYYSMLFLALGVVIWGYNIYDVILTTDNYNAQVWQDILQKHSKKAVSLGPEGIRVRF